LPIVELWIPLTVAAALLQTWRTALQQRLRNLLSVNAAGFVRYLYGVPTALLLLVMWLAATALPLPRPNLSFLLACAGGGGLQILGTNLLIMAFGYRNFAVGTAYSKTEAAQSAIIAWIVLGEALRPLAWAGIVTGLAGVLVLSLSARGLRLAQMLRAVSQPAALCGLGAGLAFALTAICVKLANQALEGPSVILRALFALSVTNALQTLMQGGWLAVHEPAELRRAFTTWRSSAWVGTLSACGSACWFSSFAMAPVAIVRSLGQVEMIFTLGFSRFYLRETLRPSEILGLVLVVGGVLLILAGR
jgi:drug/metabolite transporter (DMT)-like permease